MSAVRLLSARKPIVLALTLAALLLGLVLPPAALAAPANVLTATIVNVNGVVMGTATFTQEATGEVTVAVQVSGFNPQGGDRRLAIGEIGQCCPPSFNCSGAEVAVLPNIQFFPDGSANYRVTTNVITFNRLLDNTGSSVLIYADTSKASGIIGCGVIAPAKVAPPPSTPPPSQFPPTTVTASLGLRLRKSPSLTGAVILTLRPGETVYPLATPVVNQGISWTLLRVFRGGVAFDGYAASAYLGNAPTPPPATTGTLVVTASAGLRLRSGPGLSFAIKRIVPQGTILGATGIDQTADGIVWTKVSINGTFLWAAKQYLRAQ
jgi:Cu/Zn superoxide dismutase